VFRSKRLNRATEFEILDPAQGTITHQCRASLRDKPKYADTGCSKLACELRHIGKFTVVAGHRYEMKLSRQPNRQGVPHGRLGMLEAPGLACYALMTCSGRAKHAEDEPGSAELAQSLRFLLEAIRTARGVYRNLQAVSGGSINRGENVRPEKRLAAREGHVPCSHVGGLG